MVQGVGVGLPCLIGGFYSHARHCQPRSAGRAEEGQGQARIRACYPFIPRICSHSPHQCRGNLAGNTGARTRQRSWPRGRRVYTVQRPGAGCNVECSVARSLKAAEREYGCQSQAREKHMNRDAQKQNPWAFKGRENAQLIPYTSEGQTSEKC